jgi:hypothetical protein
MEGRKDETRSLQSKILRVCVCGLLEGDFLFFFYFFNFSFSPCCSSLEEAYIALGSNFHVITLMLRTAMHWEDNLARNLFDQQEKEEKTDKRKNIISLPFNNPFGSLSPPLPLVLFFIFFSIVIPGKGLCTLGRRSSSIFRISPRSGWPEAWVKYSSPFSMTRTPAWQRVVNKKETAICLSTPLLSKPRLPTSSGLLQANQGSLSGS